MENFVPNLAMTLAPLYSLLQKHTTWYWNGHHDKVIIHSKQLFNSEIHYDPTKESILFGDMLQYGIGAVLSQAREATGICI